MARFSPTISKLLIAATALALGVPAAAYAASSGSAQPAGSPRQVKVIPPDPAQSVPFNRLLFAGTTGVLWNPGGSEPVWTSYATGESELVPQLADAGYFEPDGPDSVWTWSTTSGVSPPGEAIIFNLDTMTESRWTLPTGDTKLGANGNSVLVQVGSGSTAQLEILTFSGSTATTTDVTGLPADTERLSILSVTTGAYAAVLTYTVVGSSEYNFGVLDWATGVVTPFAISTAEDGVNLTPTTVALQYLGAVVGPAAKVLPTDATVSAYSLADLAASPRVVSFPYADETTLAGDHVVGLPFEGTCPGTCGPPTAPAVDIPLSGAQPGTALPEALADAAGILQATDGSTVIVGGSGPGDWAVRRLSVGSQDTLTDTVVQPINAPLSNAGLAISQGMVEHVEAGPALGQAPPQYWLSSHVLDPGTLGPGSFQPPPDGGVLSNVQFCQPLESCFQLADPAFQGTPYLLTGASTGSELWMQGSDGFPWSIPVEGMPSTSASIVGSSPDFVLVDGTHPSRQYVITPMIGNAKMTTRSVRGAALWFDTLWSADGRGRLQATNLVTNSKSRPITTGARCTASAVQASQRWLYWSCGTSGPAGVYDLQHHSDVRVPAGPMLLGDGYLVRQSGTDLLMYDVHTDRLARPVTLTTDVAAVPGSNGRNVTFAVDRYSGDIAYVTPDDDIVVVSPGVPATAPAIASASFGAHPGLVWFGSGGAWSADLSLSRPVSRWTFVVRDVKTGKVVFERSGGATRMGLAVDWNGYLSHHRKARAGAYTWSLVVVPVGTNRHYTIPGGTLKVR
jgi:hypothetical protein